MRQAKVFFFVAAGGLLLAGAFHLGAQTAQGQVAGNPIALSTVVTLPNGERVPSVILENGDVWAWRGGGIPTLQEPPTFRGNLFSGAPVQATETTWGRIKAERR